MAKNEIKLRRRLVDETTLERHRNYSLLLKQHERAKRYERTKQFFIYSLLIAVVVILLLLLVSYFLVRLERERERKKEGTKTSMILLPDKSQKNLSYPVTF
jgi:heme/copper-type cytochrome/quinol oxidase subunit 2